MAEKLKIDTSSFDRDISSINSKLSQAEQKLSAIRDAGAALNAMWQGEAKDIFEEQFNSDCESMQSVIDTLKKYADGLESASSQYKKTSGQVESYINSIQL